MVRGSRAGCALRSCPGAGLAEAPSNVADKATGGRPLTQLALVATWNYMQPGVKLGRQCRGRPGHLHLFPRRYSPNWPVSMRRRGLKRFLFGDLRKRTAHVSLVIGSRTLKGTYAFRSATHGITLTFSGSPVSFANSGAMRFRLPEQDRTCSCFFRPLPRFFAHTAGRGEGRFSPELFAGDGEQPHPKIDNLYLGFRVCQISRVISL